MVDAKKVVETIDLTDVVEDQDRKESAPEVVSLLVERYQYFDMLTLNHDSKFVMLSWKYLYQYRCTQIQHTRSCSVCLVLFRSTPST